MVGGLSLTHLDTKILHVTELKEQPLYQTVTFPDVKYHSIPLQTLLIVLSPIKWAFVGVHACIHPSVCIYGCVKLCVLCVIRGPAL